MDFSKVTKIVIPEGEVSSISIGSTVVWSAVEDVEIADDWDTIIANIEASEEKDVQLTPGLNAAGGGKE